MPAFGGGDHHRALLLGAERGLRLGLGLRQGGELDRLALAVEPVELGGEPRAFRRVVLQQEIDAERGAADAAAGIDARPEQEAEMPGLGRAAEPGDVHQRGEPGVLAPAQRDETLGHEGAVEPLERDHVGDGAQRHQIEQAEEVGLGALGRPKTARTQHAVERHDGHEHQPDGGQVAELRKVVEAIGIDHGERGRQLLVGQMMVDHHHVETELARLRQRLVAAGAAIDGDQQRRALGGERAHRLHVGAVAFEQAIGDVDDRHKPALAQVARQRGRRGRAVDIVIAEDRDGFPTPDRIGQAYRRRRHAGEQVGIGHQRPHRRIEEGCDLLDRDPAPGEDARQKLGHVVVALRNRERARGALLVEPVAPGTAADRALDAEEEAPGRAGRYRQGDAHLRHARIQLQKSLRYWMKPERSASLS